jgi:BirA family transcriptional regulator, biotin operon repressor / biotin---[acetyl-CoA-carboxylase] ligase
LAKSGEALAPDSIQASLSEDLRRRIKRIEVAWSVDSTNTVLLSRPSPPNGSSEVVLAEYQTAGRGRRGRPWLAPPGGSICMSFSWNFRDVPEDLGALGLVIGICELRALRKLGVTQAKLKWPNDLLVDDRKLGGILIELRAESDGPAYVVVGVGLNVALGAPLIEKIAETGMEATDLVTAGLENPSRNAVAGAILDACLHGLLEFEREGLRPFIEAWPEGDALRGRTVNIRGATGKVARGLVRGVDLHGALLVESVDEGLKKFMSGEVSVRVEE